MIKKIFISAFILSFLTSFSLFAKTMPADYVEQFGVNIVKNQGVDTAYPARAQPNPTEDKTDLSYRVNEVLPFESSKNADMYLVYPKHGIVTPVLTPNATDKKSIADGK